MQFVVAISGEYGDYKATCDYQPTLYGSGKDYEQAADDLKAKIMIRLDQLLETTDFILLPTAEDAAIKFNEKIGRIWVRRDLPKYIVNRIHEHNSLLT